ncbi:MAG: type II secretion system protein [Phycisphaerae bacterium]
MELLIVMLLVGGLVALSVPSLRSVRLTATELQCVTNARTSMQMIDLYCGTFKDYFPTWLGDGQEVLSNEKKRSAYTYQGSHITQTARWFEWCGQPRSSRVMRCPANQDLRADPTGVDADVDYWWTSSFYIDPGYLSPTVTGDNWNPTLGARVQQRAGVMFPSSKVGVFELAVWHGWPLVTGPTTDHITLMFYQSVRPGSRAMLDGSAALEHPLPGRIVRRAPYWNYIPYETTAWGIRGRDR